MLFLPFFHLPLFFLFYPLSHFSFSRKLNPFLILPFICYLHPPLQTSTILFYLARLISLHTTIPSKYLSSLPSPPSLFQLHSPSRSSIAPFYQAPIPSLPSLLALTSSISYTFNLAPSIPFPSPFTNRCLRVQNGDILVRKNVIRCG